MTAKHTPGPVKHKLDLATPLTFDGFGINGLSEYRDRIATFTRRDNNPEVAEHFGPLFAAAPDLLEALKKLAPIVDAVLNGSGWIDTPETGAALRYANDTIRKAEGE